MLCVSIRLFVLVAALCIVAAFPVAGLCDGARLAPGDVVGVTIDGEADLTKAYQISRDGTLKLPMIDPVRITGMDTLDAAVVLTEALKKVLVNPRVTVVFVDRSKMQVYVLGQVRKAGLMDVAIGDRVLQALSQAGYDDTSDLSNVSIRRGEQVITCNLNKYLTAEDLSANAELQSGDTIVVKRADVAGMVLVLGQVAKVGSVPIKQGMTFREVMGLIGGVTVEADTSNISVKRSGSGEIIKLDYTNAMAGDPLSDIALQPGDTVYIPQLETAFFTVMGGVNRPGQYPLKGKLTLSEAIGLAGGPAPGVGDMRQVTVSRPPEAGSTSGESMNVNLTSMIAKGGEQPVVKRGDVIFVAQHKSKTNVWQVMQSILPFGWLFR